MTKSWIDAIERPILDDIVTFTTNTVLNAKDLYSIEHCKQSFGSALYILGLKRDNKAYMLQATEILNSLTTQLYRAKGFTKVGIFCIHSESESVRTIGIECLHQAFNSWMSALKSSSLGEFDYDFSILTALAKTKLIEQYEECQSAFVKSNS